MEIFNHLIIKILFSLISIAFLIYFIQLFDGFHKIKELIQIKLSGKKSVSVDELIEIDKIKKMDEEIKGNKTNTEIDDPPKLS